MKSKQQSPIWPYLGILALLFVLSLTAPRAWKPQREIPHVATARPSARLTIDAAAGFQMKSEPFESEDLMPIEQEQVDDPPSEGLPLQGPVPPAPEYADQVADEPQATEPAVAEPMVAPLALPADTDVVDEEAGELAEAPHVADAPPAADAPPETVWPLPRVLLEQLADLSQEDPQLVWPQRASDLVHRLCRDAADRPATLRYLDNLRALADQAAMLAPENRELKTAILRTRYALVRWIDIWEAAIALDETPIERRTGATSADRVEQCLAAFDALADGTADGAAWRKYLALDAVAAAARSGDDERRRAAARRVLDRLASSRLTGAQRRFAAQGPLADLQDALRAWAAAPVDVRQLLADVERYEFTTLASDAALLADDYRALKWSQPEAAEQLSRRLGIHYRNANLRLAASGEFLNLLVPQPERMDAPVRDVVVDVPVRGNSSTFTRLSIRLIPDPRRIRLGLEARGTVNSNTIASSGPATFRNQGQSTFLVRKLFVVGPHGLTIFPAIAEAENNYNYLVSLETNFDAVPLVGTLVQTIALNRHDEARAEARRQTAEKIAIRALRELDGEARDRLVEAARKIEDNQVATLRRLDMELTPVALQTDQRRVTARALLAGHGQLGAFTPRPQAPADSWLSLQVHQSALNNALAQLDLDGRSFELDELFEWVSQKLGRAELAHLDELPEDVRLTFAARDAVRVRCREQRVEVTFALAQMEHEGSRWRDFQVRTYYAGAADGLAPKFVRDDTIYLDGRSLRGKLELKLRAIFSRVLSKNRDLRLLDESMTSDPRLSGLQVTQFEIADGWIALAYSPRRSGDAVARQPK